MVIGGSRQETLDPGFILKYNTDRVNQITLDGESLEEVESFTYLDSIIDEQVGSDADVKARIRKTSAAFPQLNNMWNPKQLSINIKIIIFNMNVKTVHLCRAEIWKTTSTIIKMIQVFINSCLHEREGKNKPGFSRRWNEEKTLEVDRTHCGDRQIHHKARP
ncbi:unnamed protein product [Schistosoma margrebowiei]|uniref:Uncharacterized protein n=1 Tax=Schistosoma margrebowiei TaxID=48269 RepID=A0A183LLP4_9TREM|nr:unnamed protein product [Schistosoma margrebowiei]